jgi:hypothetical protein
MPRVRVHTPDEGTLFCAIALPEPVHTKFDIVFQEPIGHRWRRRGRVHGIASLTQGLPGRWSAGLVAIVDLAAVGSLLFRFYGRWSLALALLLVWTKS